MDPRAASELFDLALARGWLSERDAARITELHGRLSERDIRIAPLHIALREGLLTDGQVAALVPDAPAARARYPTAHPVGDEGSLAGNVLLGRIDGYPRRAGGAGAVFLAETPSGLRAAKVYAPLFGEKAPGEGGAFLLNAFLKTVRRVAAVDEPTLVRTFAAGTSSGYPFALCEHVVGRSLEVSLERRRDRRMADAKVIEIAKAALRALVTLERAGLRHRAIRPRTILLDANNRARLLPPCFVMGAAALAVEATGEVPEVAKRLAARRATDHLSPEDARGDVSVGPESDLYSLGLVLFEARAGKLPFPGAAREEKTDPDDTDDALEPGADGSGLRCAVASLRHRIHCDVPPLRELVPEVPAFLDLVVWKLTRRDPERRYRSAREALADLLRATEPGHKVIPGVDDPDESETGRLPTQEEGLSA